MSQQPQTSPIKSTLSFNSGRASPFRRPESPSTAKSTTPNHQSTRPLTPSKLANASTPTIEHTFSPRARETPLSPTRLRNSSEEEEQQPLRPLNVPSPRTFESESIKPLNVPSPRRSEPETIKPLSVSLPRLPEPPQASIASSRFQEPSPVSMSSPKSSPRPLPTPTNGVKVNMDSLSRLPPAQVREMREAFQILDQDSDGMVNREDVTEMLKSLGLDTSSGSIAPYFPASMPHPLPLPAYLSQLSSLLAPISPPQELLAALSAFDDDDSGQIDVAELMQAVTNSRPDDGSRPLSQKDVESVMEGFIGRRAFSSFGSSSNSNRGDVFRYRDWVNGLGAAGQSQPGQQKATA